MSNTLLSLLKYPRHSLDGCLLKKTKWRATDCVCHFAIHGKYIAINFGMGAAMIVGLGIDLVELARIEKIHAKFGMRFADKILTPAEIAIMPPAPVPFIAGRFAAKEAAVKALGTGFANGISPRDVEIGVDIRGKPVLRFLASASAQAQLMGVRSSHISITHEKHCAAAVVILEA